MKWRIFQLFIGVGWASRLRRHLDIESILMRKFALRCLTERRFPPDGRIRPAVVEARAPPLNDAAALDNNRPVVALPLWWRRQLPMSTVEKVVAMWWWSQCWRQYLLLCWSLSNKKIVFPQKEYEEELREGVTTTNLFYNCSNTTAW